MAGTVGTTTIVWTGVAGVNAVLDMLPALANKVIGAALYYEGNEIINRSLEIVPFDLGILSGSAVVEPPVELGDHKVSVRLGYGGPAITYAIYQHEDLTLNHDPGRQAKYLETPLLDRAPMVLHNMGVNMQRALATVSKSGIGSISNLPALTNPTGTPTITGGSSVIPTDEGFTGGGPA